LHCININHIMEHITSLKDGCEINWKNNRMLVLSKTMIFILPET